MADIHIDIERMIMHSNYLLEVSKSSASNGLSDMERKEYLDQIKELVQTVQTLLDANVALGNKQKETEAKAARDKAESDRKIAELQDKLDKLAGEVTARRRKMHGKNNEKQTGDKSVNTGKTKDEEEEEYIENCCQSIPVCDNERS